MKLFTIGDSAAQGFMSGAAARTDLSFSTLIARSLGLNPGSCREKNIDYYYPHWPQGGMPLDLEIMLRDLNRAYGPYISGLEWLTLMSTINRTMDRSEDYYERGPGRLGAKYPGNVPFFHNVSNWGFKVADAWLMTPDICSMEIEMRKPISGGDDWLACADAPLYRSACRVLNPNGNRNFSQLDWLRYHCEQEGGVENLLLWMGINNAVGPVFSMDLRETPNDPGNRPYFLPREKRFCREWNFWHPGDFEAEYRELLERIDRFMARSNRASSPRVFVGNIPSMTAAPLLKGLGDPVVIPGRGAYYEYYTYMLFDESVLQGEEKLYIPRETMIYIDQGINEYNRIIIRLIEEKNKTHQIRYGRPLYYLVDICAMMNRAAWQKNHGSPDFSFPTCSFHPGNGINTQYYHADENGNMCRGGFFSLDGIHPSAIGQGSIAREFITVMEAAGVGFVRPLDWDGIFRSDNLYCDPIPLMQELYSHPKLGYFLTKKLQSLITQLAAGV